MSSDERRQAVPGWTSADNALVREFTFKDFAEAFAFMGKVAAEAENMHHHPDWSNSYNRVTIRLATHSAGGVTDKDIALAARINALE